MNTLSFFILKKETISENIQVLKKKRIKLHLLLIWPKVNCHQPNDYNRG